MVRKLAEATGSISFSMRGEKGESGDTPYVTKTVVDYAITSSVSEAKKWSSTAPDASAASNKGKFLWTRTTYTWSNNKTTENITYTYIGKDGKDGTSVTINGSKGSTSELPTSGNTLGDGYIIDGYLWVYTGTSKTDSTHARGFENVGKIQGDPGVPAVQYYTHIAWMKDSNGTGFTTSSNGGEYPYVGVLVDKISTDSTDWTKYDWSYVKGEIGATGNGIKSTEVTYQIWNSGTSKPKGTWSTSIPNITDANPYLWTRTIFVYTDGTRSDPSFSVATRGTKGALMREHDGFESGKYKYLSGSGAEEYVDVVYIKNSDKWWKCIVSYDDDTDSPKLDDGHWKVMNSFKSIATHLLLAENATINMLGSNQINLYNPSGGAMFGSFRVVDKDTDYAFWLGGSTGASATTSITRGGKLKSTSAEITGKITATSGKVGGLKIEGDSLTNEGFNNDAYIVLRNDTNKVFAGIGGNVLPATAGDTRAVARFTIENTSNSFIGGINYAVICGAKGKATNVALDMTLGGYITGLRIKNAYLSSGGSIYSQAIDIPKNAHSVVLAGSGYYRLPQMEKEDDGYIVFIKRITDSGDIHLLSGFARDSKDGFHTSAIYYDRGSATTDLKIESSGDAMILVYHREMTVTINSTTYEGCWIQYKCPRDW